METPIENFINWLKKKDDVWKKKNRKELFQHIAKTTRLSTAGYGDPNNPNLLRDGNAISSLFATIPKLAKGPENQKSRYGKVRSPTNVVYEFKNIRHFVRENPQLFLPEDTVWRITYSKNNKKEEGCKASRGLTALFGKGKKVPGSWKGWTVVSDTESDINKGKDLLQRAD